VTRPAPRRALAVVVCALVLLPLLAAGPAAGAAQEQRATTTVLEKGDRPTNYEGFTLLALGLAAWAVVFGVILYRSPRRASALRRGAP